MNEERRKKWIEERKSRRKNRDAKSIFEALRQGDRVALSSALTLLESSATADRVLAKDLIQLALPYSGKSRRIGITGVPGVGKSTFVEAFGKKIIAEGKRLAVLAIDPSSEKGGGSILGDKTRMEVLSAKEEAFIRPSPSGSNLGGVARATRESILLCEAAGYDYVFVETVGVGQSETVVHSMVDFFLLLMLAGAGDELQGIKRGIMEMADLLLINKADGENKQAARNAQREYKNALHLLPPKESGWTAKTATISALESYNLDLVSQTIDEFWEHVLANGFLDLNRNEQDVRWFHEAVKSDLLNLLYKGEGAKERQKQLEDQIQSKKVSPFEAADSWLNEFLNKHGIRN